MGSARTSGVVASTMSGARLVLTYTLYVPAGGFVIAHLGSVTLLRNITVIGLSVAGSRCIGTRKVTVVPVTVTSHPKTDGERVTPAASMKIASSGTGVGITVPVGNLMVMLWRSEVI